MSRSSTPFAGARAYAADRRLPKCFSARLAALLRRRRVIGFGLGLLAASGSAAEARVSTATEEPLLYHRIRVDANGHIVPWFHDTPGVAYHHVIGLVWNFWDKMRTDLNGLPYYMNHQVWQKDFNDPRGIGGDQVAMALSSWALYYMYSGNEQVKETMRFMADHTLQHGLSPGDCAWPHLPFPYNTLVYSGVYDGDMVIGEGYLQPDKAGSFGWELLTLFKMMSAERYPHATEQRYLAAAIRIADTLARHVRRGDNDVSPLPFKVNAFTSETGPLHHNDGSGASGLRSSYTTNWSGTLRLWRELIALNQGDVEAYRRAYTIVVDWMKQYPLRTHKWGPFFEDIPGWSDTQINAMTFARFMMEHPQDFPDWQREVADIFGWVYRTLGNQEWSEYGVTVVNEQTAYQTPGNSHSARQAADELLYGRLTGDRSRRAHAIRQLNWATYMVDHDGKNCYPRDEVWLTDGYGDYVRHYLRAMAAAPELAPPGQNRVLATTSVMQHVAYAPRLNKLLTPVVPAELVPSVAIYYRVFDAAGTEQVRLAGKPRAVWLDRRPLPEAAHPGAPGWRWEAGEGGGLLTVVRAGGRAVLIFQPEQP